MDEKQEAAESQEQPAAMSSEQQQSLRRLQDRYLPSRPQRKPSPWFLSDGDKYRWIRANRGHFAIDDALRNADRDTDFDELILSAIRVSAAGPHCFGDEIDERR